MRKALLVFALAAVVMTPAAAQAKRVNLIFNFGQDVFVGGKDDVNVRATCVQNYMASGFDTVLIYAVTANDAVMRGGSFYPGNGTYLTSMTAPTSSLLAITYFFTGEERYYNNIDGSTVLNLTTMRGYGVNLESTIMAVNIAGTGDCLVSLDLKQIKSFKTAD